MRELLPIMKLENDEELTRAYSFGYWGEGDVFTYCHAGGLGDLLCNQVNPTTIVIDSTPPPVNP